MRIKPLLVFGAGQVAEVFGDYLTRSGIRPDAYVVDARFWEPAKFIGDIPVVTFENLEQTFPCPAHFVVGMSFRGLNRPRSEKFEILRARGYDPLTYRHSMVGQSPSAKIGIGSFVMDLNNLQAEVEIGENCILWSGNHVGHHTKIGNHVFVASHVVISGACEIGDYSFIGVNATIRDGVKIGKRNIIGAGALILHDTPDDAVYKVDETPRSKVTSDRIRF